jgi:hypothetical protein
VRQSILVAACRIQRDCQMPQGDGFAELVVHSTPEGERLLMAVDGLLVSALLGAQHAKPDEGVSFLPTVPELPAQAKGLVENIICLLVAFDVAVDLAQAAQRDRKPPAGLEFAKQGDAVLVAHHGIHVATKCKECPGEDVEGDGLPVAVADLTAQRQCLSEDPDSGLLIATTFPGEYPQAMQGSGLPEAVVDLAVAGQGVLDVLDGLGGAVLTMGNGTEVEVSSGSRLAVGALLSCDEGGVAGLLPVGKVAAQLMKAAQRRRELPGHPTNGGARCVGGLSDSAEQVSPFDLEPGQRLGFAGEGELTGASHWRAVSGSAGTDGLVGVLGAGEIEADQALQSADPFGVGFLVASLLMGEQAQQVVQAVTA